MLDTFIITLLMKGRTFMNVQIFSRKEIETIIVEGKFPENTAVISFCDCGTKPCDRVDFGGAG